MYMDGLPLRNPYFRSINRVYSDNQMVGLKGPFWAKFVRFWADFRQSVAQKSPEKFKVILAQKLGIIGDLYELNRAPNG